MSHWYCPHCHAGLYWHSNRVRLGHPSGEGKCPFCGTSLTVRASRTFWFLAFTGWIAFFLVTVVDHQLLPNLATQYLALSLEPRTIGVVALALQLPLLVLGPRFEVRLPRQS